MRTPYFNPPANPVNGAIYRNFGIIYVYSAATNSWDCLKETRTSDLTLSEVNLVAVSEINNSKNYSERGLQNFSLFVNSSTGVASPINPLSGSPFNTIGNAVSWLKDKRFRAGITVTIELSDGVHLINSSIEIEASNVGKLIIKGTLASFDAITNSFTEVAAATSLTESSLATTILNRFNNSKSTVRFSGEGLLILGDLNKVYFQNIIFEGSTSPVYAPTAVGSAIKIKSSEAVVFQFCLVRNISTTGTTVFISAEEDGTEVELIDCVFIRSAIGRFKLQTLTLTKVSCLSNSGVSLYALCCQIQLTDVCVARSNQSCLLFRSSSVSMTRVKSYASATQFTIDAAGCLIRGATVECERGVNGPYFLGCRVGLDAYRGDTLQNHAMFVHSCSAYISNSFFRNSGSGNPTIQGGLRALGSSVIAINCEYSGNTQGGAYLTGGTRIANVGATGAQAYTANVAYNTVGTTAVAGNTF